MTQSVESYVKLEQGNREFPRIMILQDFHLIVILSNSTVSAHTCKHTSGDMRNLHNHCQHHSLDGDQSTMCCTR